MSRFDSCTDFGRSIGQNTDAPDIIENLFLFVAITDGSAGESGRTPMARAILFRSSYVCAGAPLTAT